MKSISIIKKFTNLLLAILCIACNNNQSSNQIQEDSTANTTDTVAIDPPSPQPKADSVEDQNPQPPAIDSLKTYSNQRFKDVTVEKTGEHQFIVKGKAQIFEANFSWVVEDGHEELKQGHTMTDAGAPAWGNFNFTIDVPKKRANSTLHLILFEVSAKDGSRQYELPVLLY